MSRFDIRIDGWWRPLLVPFGTPDRSYVEFTDDGRLRAVRVVVRPFVRA